MRPSLFLKLLVSGIFVSAPFGAGAGAAPWAGHDYINLYFSIFNGQVPLPHLRDEEQKALFNHLVDSENLHSIEFAPVAGDEKLRQLELILATLGAYRSRYNYAVFVGEPLEQELALVQAYELQVLGSMAKLSPPAASRASWVTLIGGVIDAVENHKTYSPQQSALMAEAFARNYPAIALALSYDERNLVHAEAMTLNAADDNAIRRQAKDQIRRSVIQ